MALPQRNMRRCPKCKRGLLSEDSIGVYCSRRYAAHKPCRYESNPLAEGQCAHPPAHQCEAIYCRKCGAFKLSGGELQYVKP